MSVHWWWIYPVTSKDRGVVRENTTEGQSGDLIGDKIDDSVF